MISMTLLKAKCKATMVHAVVTLLICLSTGLLVFGVWYPGEMARMAEGASIYQLLVMVEITLGPLMSLIIFNPAKPFKELARDYAIIGAVQITALAYGLSVISTSRPVYQVFVKDRIEIVAATELDEDDLVQASAEFSSLPLLGPRLVCVDFPSNEQEQAVLTKAGSEGKDIHLLPMFYRECQAGEIESRSLSRDQLKEVAPSKFSSLPVDLREAEFVWLPALTRFSDWVVIYPEGNTAGAVYVDIDPFAPQPPQGDGQS